MTRPGIRRRGSTLLELMVALGLAGAIVGAAFLLLATSGRAERRVDRRVDAVESAASCFRRIQDDLDRASSAAGGNAVSAGWDEYGSWLWVPSGSGGILFRADSDFGVLWRYGADGSVRSFDLGDGGTAWFDVASHRAAGAALVRFRIEARQRGASDGAPLVLEGAVPMPVAQSRAVFPWWNG